MAIVIANLVIISDFRALRPVHERRHVVFVTSEVWFRFTKKVSRGSEPKSLVGESVCRTTQPRKEVTKQLYCA